MPFLLMAEILNIKLKNENFAIVEFDSGVGLVVPKLLVYELGLRKRRHPRRRSPLTHCQEKTNFTVVNKRLLVIWEEDFIKNGTS